MIANILPTDFPLDTGGQNSTFSDHQINGYHRCSNMVATILPADPSALGVKRSKFSFSEHGHVAYQIKGNHKCSNMVANDLPVDPPDPGVESNGQSSTF